VSKAKGYLLFLLIGLIIGFLAGAWLVPDFLRTPKSGTAPQSRPGHGEPQQSAPAREMLDEISGVFEQAASKVGSSCVAIIAEQVVAVQTPSGTADEPLKEFSGKDLFRRFFGQPPQAQKRTIPSLGSGVIISADGMILTNNHVVAKAEKLLVALRDKKTYPAKIIGTDPQTDLAIIKIEAADLPAASLGDSEGLKVGQWVIAVGNPLQMMHTVTAGIISAKGRSSVGLAEYEDFIQTDASINPGNSGGALADLNGDVIGINTAISSLSGGSIGIGFAIPINMARQVINDLIAKGKVSRGYIGIVPEDIDKNQAKQFNLTNAEGVFVAAVAPKGPADQAGIEPGDVIMTFHGERVRDATQLKMMIAETAPETAVKIGLVRQGRAMEVTVIAAEEPSENAGKNRP
jgi:serine protease Do